MRDGRLGDGQTEQQRQNRRDRLTARHWTPQWRGHAILALNQDGAQVASVPIVRADWWPPGRRFRPPSPGLGDRWYDQARQRLDAELIRYGYVLLFVGVAIEADAFLIAGAFLAPRGYFDIRVV